MVRFNGNLAPPNALAHSRGLAPDSGPNTCIAGSRRDTRRTRKLQPANRVPDAPQDVQQPSEVFKSERMKDSVARQEPRAHPP